MSSAPLLIIGLTPDGRYVLGGAFQMSDTLGFPLFMSIDEAERRGCVISFPHYFASAMEAGWDDEQTFCKIQEALEDRSASENFSFIKGGCISMFMRVAEKMEGKTAAEIGRAMREQLEHNEPRHPGKA